MIEEIQNKTYSKLNSYSCNLVIIEDLKVKDIENVILFIKGFPESKFSLVIPVFNVQYTDDNLNHKINYDDYTLIEREFDKTNLFHEVVLFQEINKSVAENWLYKQYNSKIENKEDNKLKNIIENHNFKYNGLKGLAAKIKLEDESYDVNL